MAATLVLAACGGGGEDSPAAGNRAAQTPLALTTGNMFAVATYGAGVGETVLQIGQLAVDHAQRFAVARATTSFTETCPNGGVVILTLTDRDGNGRASAGDTVTALFRDCGVPLLGETLAGEVAVDLAAATGSPPSSLRGSVTLGSGLTIVGPPTASQGVTVKLLGSLAFDWTRSDTRTTLAVTSTAADDLRIVGTDKSVTVTDSIRAITASKALNYDQARSVVNVGLRFESESLGGSVTMSTPTAVKAYLNTYPEQGLIELRGAGGGKISLVPNFVSNSDRVNVALDSNGDGVAEASDSYPWASATDGYLWWDGTTPLAWSLQPYFVQSYLATSFTLAFPAAGVANGVNDVQRLQFTRELATPATLYFRYVDQGSTLGYDPVMQNVEADVTRQGALILVRPRQQLRHARSYNLQVSTDGITWNQNVTVQDSLGNSYVFYSASVVGFATPDSLRAVATVSGPALSNASAQAQLSATGSISTTRPIASYRWTQLGGTPLQFSNPDAATTQLSWGPAAPTGVENVSIELTVTDTAGEVEHARISVPSFNSATAGRLLYFRSSPGDYIGAGQTQVVSDTTGNFSASPANSGYVSYNYNTPDYSAWWALNLASADGLPLAVGAYENAVRAPFHGSQPGLELSGSGRGCNTLSGRFVVLELQTDAQGVLTRLAVDFEQHCEGPQAPPLFGSLRVNSAVPITQ